MQQPPTKKIAYTSRFVRVILAQSSCQRIPLNGNHNVGQTKRLQRNGAFPTLVTGVCNAVRDVLVKFTTCFFFSYAIGTYAPIMVAKHFGHASQALAEVGGAWKWKNLKRDIIMSVSAASRW